MHVSLSAAIRRAVNLGLWINLRNEHESCAPLSLLSAHWIAKQVGRRERAKAAEKFTAPLPAMIAPWFAASGCRTPSELSVEEGRAAYSRELVKMAVSFRNGARSQPAEDKWLGRPLPPRLVNRPPYGNRGARNCR